MFMRTSFCKIDEEQDCSKEHITKTSISLKPNLKFPEEANSYIAKYLVPQLDCERNKESLL